MTLLVNLLLLLASSLMLSVIIDCRSTGDFSFKTMALFMTGKSKNDTAFDI